MRKKTVWFWAVLVFFPGFWACSGSGEEADGAYREALDSAKRAWAELYLVADHERLIREAVPFVRQAALRRDTLSMVTGAAYAAQSYYNLEQKDSAEAYLRTASRYRHRCGDWGVNAMILNLEGMFAVKFELNYPKALTSFWEMYRYSQAEGRILPQLLALSNIVSIYYIMGDRYGLEYAEKACGLLEELDRGEPFYYLYEQAALLSLARMKFLSGETVEAGRLADRVDSLCTLHPNLPIDPSLVLLRADLYAAAGTDAYADSCYRTALTLAGKSDVGIISLIYRNYGRFCERSGRYAMAEELYEEGLDYSLSYGNMLYRNDFLESLSEVNARLGNPSKAYDYAMWLQRYRDTLSLREMEQEFGALQLSYQSMESRFEIQSRELELMKARKKTQVSYSVVAVIVLVLLMTLYQYGRQKRMNRLLVEQHQESMRQFQAEQELRTENRTENEKALFLKIERMMREDEIYRMKDLTLDRLAEMLQTNRSYLSKAINEFSGMTFSHYLNRYRIDKAAEIISDPNRNVLMKQLADDLGYSSTNVFSKAFVRRTGVTPTGYRSEMLSKAGK